GGRLGVGADDGRHDGGVDDAQALDAVHPQVGVDHGLVAGAHRAGPDRVVGGAAVGLDELDVVVLGAQRALPGQVLGLDVAGHRRLGHDLPALLHALRADLDVVVVGQE